MPLQELSAGATISGATSGAMALIESLDFSGKNRGKLSTDVLDSMFTIVGPGQIDPGELTLNILFDPAQAEKLFDATEADPEVWTITTSGGSTLVCAGFISQVGMAFAVGQFIKQAVKITFCPAWGEAPVFTPAVAS